MTDQAQIELPETFPDIFLPKGHPRSPYKYSDVILHFYLKTEGVHEDYISYQIWWVEGMDPVCVDKKWSPYYYYYCKSIKKWTLRWWDGFNNDMNFNARTPQEAYEQVRSLILKGYRLRRKGL